MLKFSVVPKLLFSIMKFRIHFNMYDLIWRISFEAAAKRKPYIIQKQPTEVIYKKKLFLKISEYLQENTCVGVSF